MAERTSNGRHHQPVLVQAVVSYLITDVDGAYLDLTAGGGGHLKALSCVLSERARLYAVDRDRAAVERTEQALQATTQFRCVVQLPFADIAESVDRLGERSFDGILMDLGISSYQLDEPSRGFSFRHNAPLDMRFDSGSGVTAEELVNSLGEQELKKVLRDYGEERQAARIARAIVRERQRGMITTTAQLRDVVLTVVRPPYENKSLARVFQAFRIAVNRELEQIEKALPAALSLLKGGGRLAVIAYHSLEDRLVKRFFQAEKKGVCTCPPGLPVCQCGGKPTLKILTPKPIVPDAREVDANPRARSARLRVAERLA